MKKNIPYKILNVFLILGFLPVIFSMFFMKNVRTSNFSFFLFFSSLCLIIIAWFFLYKVLLKKNDYIYKKRHIIIPLYFFVLFVIQVIVGYYLRVIPSWDFGMIFKEAKSYVNSGMLEDANYFINCPNNIPILIINVILYKTASLIGISDFYIVGMLTNIIIVDLSIFITYLTVKKIFNFKRGIMSLVIFSFFTPIFLYVPIFYTDTMSMLFPILIVYLYVLFKNLLLDKKGFILLITISFLTFIGMKIKITVSIVLIAILIDLFISLKFKDFIKISFTLITPLLVLLFLYPLFVNKTGILPYKIQDTGVVPYTHWVMMGMSKEGDGGYFWEDLKYTLSFETKKEREKANIAEIKNRLDDFGIGGYMNFLLKKASMTWGDGTYFAPQKLSRRPVRETKLHQIVLTSGKYYKYYYNFCFALQFLFLTIMIFENINNFYKTRKNKTNFVYIAVFGLFLFLLLWETRSRYIVNFIPLFVLIISSVNINFKKPRNNEYLIDSD